MRYFYIEAEAPNGRTWSHDVLGDCESKNLKEALWRTKDAVLELWYDELDARISDLEHTLKYKSRYYNTEDLKEQIAELEEEYDNIDELLEDTIFYATEIFYDEDGEVEYGDITEEYLGKEI